MSTVCGIDYSTRAVDLVLLDETEDTADQFRVELDHRRGPFLAVRGLRRRFAARSWFEDRAVYLIGMEDPFSRANHTAKVLGYVAGALAVLLPPEIPVLLVPPAEWKRLLTGKGSASKGNVAQAVRRRIWADDSTERWPPDAFDAYGIAFAARHLNQQAIEKGAA